MATHKTTIINDRGETVEANAPIIVSASRSTDIPAFYCDWFFERLRKGCPGGQPALCGRRILPTYVIAKRLA